MPSGDIDTLITRSLRAPMLTELLNGQGMKAELGAVAHEIMRRWVAKFPKESGNAVSTAKVTYHRRKTKYDNRWEAEFSAGGRRAPYVAIVEAEEHILAQVLRDMGFNTGDSRTVAPPGERKTTTVYHRTTAEKADKIEREGFRPTYRDGAKPADPNRQEYGYFTENPNDLPGYGSQVVATEVPSHLLEHDPGSGHFRVRVEHLEGKQFRREGGSEAADRAESEARSAAERGLPGVGSSARIVTYGQGDDVKVVHASEDLVRIQHYTIASKPQYSVFTRRAGGKFILAGEDPSDPAASSLEWCD
jgi:hypothetical protein